MPSQLLDPEPGIGESLLNEASGQEEEWFSNRGLAQQHEQEAAYHLLCRGGDRPCHLRARTLPPSGPSISVLPCSCSSRVTRLPVTPPRRQICRERGSRAWVNEKPGNRAIRAVNGSPSSSRISSSIPRSSSAVRRGGRTPAGGIHHEVVAPNHIVSPIFAVPAASPTQRQCPVLLSSPKTRIGMPASFAISSGGTPRGIRQKLPRHYLPLGDGSWPGAAPASTQCDRGAGRKGTRRVQPHRRTGRVSTTIAASRGLALASRGLARCASLRLT